MACHVKTWFWDTYHGCSAPPTNSVEPVVIKPVRTCWVLPVCGFRFGSNLLNLLVIKWIFLNLFGEPLWTCFPAQRWLIIVRVWTKTRSRPRSQKRHRHKNVRTEILCRMVRSRGPQLSRGLFSWQFLCLCLGAIFGQVLTDLLLARSTFNERVGTVHAGSISNEIYF